MGKYSKHLMICADPIWPDIDKFEEELFHKKLKGYGILDFDFWLDEGLGLEYDPEILEPGMIIEGMQTFYLSNSPDIDITFKYDENCQAICITSGGFKLFELPLIDYFEASYI